MSRILTQRLAILVAAAWLVLIPVRAEAQKALVYCPVGVDATGCNTIVAALAASSTLFPDGVDAGYDGTSGTVDLAGGDLSGYAVFVVPSLADGPDVQPYALLRNGTIAARLQAAFMGRVAVWSGTPDVGSTNRVAKDNLIRNLAGWARADAAGTHGPGVVALQDNSDDEAARYGWVGSISALSVAGDPTFDVYSNVQALTSTGQTILTSGGVQLGYTNMASYGLLGGTGTSADATGGHSGRVVLVTTAGDPSAEGIATVLTDREDYFPPDTVIVTGAGWEPGEAVHLLFQQDVNPNGSVTLTTVADGSGHILDQQFVIDSAHIGVRFTLTATGQTSGRTAQATFTDATGLNTVTMLGTQTPTTVAPGGAVTYGTLASNSVQVRFNGNGSCTVAMTVTGLPAGAVATFAPPTLTGTSTGNLFTLLTITTSAATPTGTSNLTVRATGTGGAGNDCSTATTQTAAATLVVKRPSTTTVSGPAASNFGQLVTFTATVTGAGATPTGTVQFKDGAVNLGTPQTLVAGSASVGTSALSVASHSITADYSGDGNYTASTSAVFTHVVSKADQAITFTSSAPAGAVVGGTTYTAAATATSGLTVAFSSTTPSVCSSGGLNGSAISFIAAGTCIVAANQAGNGNFNAASQVTQSFAVGTGSQAITFTSTAPVAAVYNGAVYTATATGGASGNPVTFSTLTTSVCTSSGTNGATISFVGVGSCTVAADQAGNANYSPATQTTQIFAVGKASQTIAFDLSTLPAKTFGDADFSVASFASASSGLTVSFSSGSITRCTVSAAGLVHIITAAGNCMVIASQPGDANYNAATNVQQTFNVAKAAQTITFTSTAPVGAIVGGPTYTATATATSGLTVTFSSSTTGVCTSSGTNGATITFVGGGSCIVAANQIGNGDYNAAPQVTQTFAVSAQAPQTISFTSTAPSNAVFGGTYAVSATATSGLTVAFSSLTTGVCTVAGSTVSFVGVGPCTVAANQAGNASFLPAPQVTQAFAVGKADQTITFAALADKIYGNADFGVSATASSLLTTTFAAIGQCTVAVATVHLTGAGSCTITASQAGNANYNPAADVPQTFTIHGAPVAPVITVANKDYDGTTAATIVTRNLTGAVSGDDVSLIGGTAVFTTKHADTGKPVTADGFSLSGTDAVNYVLSPTTASTTANIARLAITVTAATDSREYDGTNLSAAVPTTPAGSIQTGDVAAFTETFDNKNIGTGKALTPAGAVDDGNSGLNYLVSFQPVTTGEITAKALTGSITAADKPYNGNTSATITSRTLDGVIGTETVNYVGGTATFDNRNAGTGKTVNATGLSLGGGDAGNYTVNTTASTTANIDQLPITVTAVTDSKTYDGTATSDETPAVSVNAIILPDVANFTQAFDNKNAGTGKTLTPSGAVNDGNSGGNYLVSFIPVTTGTIEQRTLTVTASASSRPYNGTRVANVTLSDDRVTDDVLTVNYVDALFSDKNAGTNKTVTVSGLSLSGTDGGNYVLAATSATATADITPVTLTGHFTADNKVYNGTNAADILTRTLTGGIISGDDVSLTGGTATFSNKNVGSPKTVTGLGFSLDGTDGPNYVLASTTLTTSANITRRDLTVAATGVNKIYDGTADATVTLSDDRVAGDVLTDSYTSATFANKNVGNGKSISVTGISIGNTDAGNYTLLNTTASASANITAATATGHFTAANKFYDGGTAATIVTRTLTGTFGTDDVSLVGGTATFSDKHAGAGKTVTGNGFSLTGGDATNYVLASSTLTTSANIDQRPVTVTADAKSKVFGQADPPLTYFISSGTVVAGDPFSGALTRALGEGVGSWAILQGTLTLGPDYNLAYIGASLTINPWSLTGFYQPVDMPTGGMVLNSIKGGQTVPLKFEIFAGAVEKTDVSAVQSFILTEVSCPSSSTVDDIELTSTGGTVLRYDGPAGQFIQNWQTPKTAGKCYKVTMTAADAVSKLIAYFKTK